MPPIYLLFLLPSFSCIENPHLQVSSQPKLKVADERPIPTLGDTDLDDLTYGRLRAIRRAEEQIRIVRDASQLLYEAQMILLEFSDPYHPTANILLWDIEARMEVLVDEFLALWAEEIQDRAFELRQFK
ncbi:hypothetical protein N7536_012104 [Penicillium majusculum]|nr:hypothetical protein N7536_012104 [Penicillium majusculum]